MREPEYEIEWQSHGDMHTRHYTDPSVVGMVIAALLVEDDTDWFARISVRRVN